MSTLFKRPNSKYWQCAFTSATGRRLYRSTNQTKKGKAREVATEFEKRARNLDPEGQQEQRAMLAVLEEATTDALRGKLTGDLGRDYLERLLHLAGSSANLRIPSVEEWLGKWLNDKKRTTKKGTAERYRYVIEAFLEFLPPEKRVAPLTALQSDDIQQFRDRLTDDGKTAATVNLSVKTLRVPLNLARKHGYIRTNPAELVEILKLKGKTKTAFTRAQVEALLRKAHEKSKISRTERERNLYRDWEVAILAAYYTGQRQSDVANLKWSQIDFGLGALKFRQTKTDTAIVVPLRPELENSLKALPGLNDADAQVFPALFGKTSGGNNGLSGMFRRLMDAAEIENTTIEGNGKGRNRRALTFHSLRHAFNSHLAEAGVPQEVRQLLTGHASGSVNDRYTHLGLEVLRDAVGKLPKLCN
ncbi:MAG: integrase [Verrucomicrobiales bacterium]|jgi:integrase